MNGRAVSRARLYRTIGLALSLGIASVAASLFLQFAASDGLQAIDALRVLLITISTWWLAWGASQSVVGLCYRAERHDTPSPDIALSSRTAILVPVYNEDPVETFSRVAAMDTSLERLGVGRFFDFAILSDTRDPEIAALEEAWFARLMAERGGQGRFYYRRRTANTGKKAGNIEDFLIHSGGAYAFALILDADSLMEGETILEMARRMEAEPRLGLLQTLPRIVNASSLFGRVMQFSSGFFSKVFARGIALMAGREGPFWGHNAMVRTRAFASSCGLPELSGRPPFGGHILSHDYVEAALLAANGWVVRLDTDLAGSYEEGPETIIEFAKRDRRWCQGNLQHGRLLAAPGLKLWNRFTFVQGMLAYLASPMWAAFLALSLVAPYLAPPPDYFPEPYQLFPVFPDDQTSKAIALFVGIFGLLILPKLLILGRGILSGDVAAYGGAGAVSRSVGVEILISSLVAPIMLLFQTRSVLQVLTGIDGGWPATQRGAQSLSFWDAWVGTRWMVAIGGGGLLVSSYYTPEILFWLLPVAAPMILAPFIVWLSARPLGRGLFLSAEELGPPAILQERERILLSWRGETPFAFAAAPASEMRRHA